MEIQTKDVLREISNIGIGSCMTSLSHIISKEVHYSVSYVSELENYGDMMDWFKKADDHVAGVSVPFDGDIAGTILLIYRPALSDTILQKIFGSAPEWGSISNEMLDMIQETANIMASSYLSSLSAYTSWHIQAGCSAASTDMAGAMIGEIAGMAVKADSHVLCIGSRFGTEPGGQENCMMMMLYEHSIPGFLEALEGKKCVRL